MPSTTRFMLLFLLLFMGFCYWLSGATENAFWLSFARAGMVISPVIGIIYLIGWWRKRNGKHPGR